MGDTKEPEKKNRDEKGRLLPGHAATNGGRTRMREDVRAMLYELTPKVVQRWAEALDATRAVVVGNGPHATMEMVVDHDVRVKTGDIIMSRLHGKPAQEVTGTDGGSLFGALVPDMLDSMRKLVEDK